ncbi:murein L,D-transpeptidase [Stella sp.]|uniref:L,D-transpeptidase family protein n=1 Tax=Stella sp. TaxID=2912054 RepID=UPI0035B0F9E3
MTHRTCHDAAAAPTPAPRRRRPATVSALAFAVLAALPAAAAQPGAPPPSAVERPSVPTWIADFVGEQSTALSGWPGRQVGQLREFYAAADFQPRWTAESGALNERGRALLATLAQAEEHGLSPEALGVPALQAMAEKADPAQRPQVEVALTGALVRFAGWLLGVEREEGAPRHTVFVLDQDQLDTRALARMIEAGDIPRLVAALSPAHSQYQRLLAARRLYKERAAQQAAAPRIPTGPTIRAGYSDARVPAIRARLAALGADVGTTDQPTRYDPKLRQAVMEFQAAHRLQPDGSVGRATLDALNAGPADRLVQIDATLERWRRMPRDLGARHVLVNVPAYTLKVVEGDRATMQMKVVVGTRARQTPTFSSRLATVEINPTWSVPAKLAAEDILPAIRRNPNYLEEHNIRVLAVVDGRVRQIDPAEIDWESQAGRRLPFRFRQDPGAGNSLGKVKMMLPNDEAIYLHDTPKRSLFQRTARAYSSGCIRLEKPDLFANLLLTEGAGWTQEQIDAAFAQRGTRAVPLRDSLPVHIAYLTAWVDDDGKAVFHDDIYGQDERVVQMLRARKPLPAPPPAERLRTASARD